MTSTPSSNDSKDRHFGLRETVGRGVRWLQQHTSRSPSRSRPSSQHSASPVTPLQDAGLASTHFSDTPGKHLHHSPDLATITSRMTLDADVASTTTASHSGLIAGDSPATTGLNVDSPKALALQLNIQPPSPTLSAIPNQMTSTQAASHLALDATEQTQLLHQRAVVTASTIPKPTTLDNAKEAGKTAWANLKMTLQLLEESLNMVPILRSAVGEVAACLDAIEAAAKNRKDYEHLATELQEVTDTLRVYVRELGLEEHSNRVASISSSIRALVKHINKKRGRWNAKRIIESTQDKEDSDIMIQTMQNSNKQLTSALLQGMLRADDAQYNSIYSMTIKRKGCTPETRKNMQADLQAWVRNLNAPQVYWMNGMAGTGKTTIAYSLCKWLEENELLGASFFCSRVSVSCRNVQHIMPTIAYQIAQRSPDFQRALCKILDKHPNTSNLEVMRQFEKLVQEPMQEAKDKIPSGLVVVIDALDECQDNHGTRQILQVLLRYASSLPLKFFVTSRPEPMISDNLLSAGEHSPSIFHLHDIEQSIVEEDIKKYLTEALKLMLPPPSNDQIEKLAKRAGKLFIYAATAVRYIYPDDIYVDSSARLRTMLALDSNPANEHESSKKYAELNQLYTTILDTAFDKLLEPDEAEHRRLVLRTVVCAREPMTTQALASLLGLIEEQVVSALRPLQSVLHISTGSGFVSALHASFPDYMLDQLRSGVFYCDEMQHGYLLANRCFKIMREQLSFNICQLESSFVFDKDVPDLANRVEKFISPGLFYACRYWAEHLSSQLVADEFHGHLVDFFSRRLLFWMEVLNLKQCIGMGAPILLQVQNWLSKMLSLADMLRQTAEARDFVAQFAANPCSRGTPHIYISSLPFLPKTNSIYTNYWARTRGLMDVRKTSANQMERAMLATWLTASPVSALAFSSDGARIVTGSSSGTICIRDAHTSDIISGPFQGHPESINLVAFSPDGTHIVSGSGDSTIQVWDARSGSIIIGPFEGHPESVKSVAFSHDGTHIICVFNHCIIRVWEAHTGTIVGGSDKENTLAGVVQTLAFSPDGTRIASTLSDDLDNRVIAVQDEQTGTVAGLLCGHTGRVNSLVFSPDGTRIVSGSDDCTIQVWDVCTGAIVAGPLTGHTQQVNSVAFSPDGTRIVSGSDDRTIRMWYAHTSVTTTGSPNKHSKLTCSVAFSSTGTHFISGYRDHTLQVWDARSGTPTTEILKGHTGVVNSVAYAPDGRRIASGSDDCTILVWDACTGTVVAGPLKGHTRLVNSVAFSPDSTRIVSGSNDRLIIVWDAETGGIIAGPLQGHRRSVYSVAFSPDGTRIASGSYDCTILVWDASAGNIVAGPFEGHKGPVNSVSFSLDNTRIVSGSDDCTVLVWDAQTGVIITRPFKGHKESVKMVAFAPDDKSIVSGSKDGTIQMWSIETGIVTAGPFTRHIKPSHSIAFSSHGVHVVTSVSSDLSSSHETEIRVLRLYQQADFHGAPTSDWTSNADGWITAGDKPLFWVLRELHDYLPYPPDTLVISPRGSSHIDYRELAWGEKWISCYAPE